MVRECGVWTPNTDQWSITANGVLSEARKKKIPVGFKTVGEFAAYLKSIAPERCPVFGEKLKRSKDTAEDFSFSVDKINPKKGYVRGNIRITSQLFNRMKQDAMPIELVQFAKWWRKFSKERMLA